MVSVKSGDGDGVGIRGGRGKDDAVDLGVLRYRDIGRIGKTESRSIRWAIGNPIWRPVGGRIPVARDGIEIPLGTDRVRNGWNEEHQRAANRCQKVITEVAELLGFSIDSWFFLSFPRNVDSVAVAGLEGGEEPSGENVLRLIQIRLEDVEFGKISPTCQEQFAAIADRRFEFHKRRQLFIRVHNETVSVAAMCVSNVDRVPVGIHA